MPQKIRRCINMRRMRRKRYCFLLNISWKKKQWPAWPTSLLLFLQVWPISLWKLHLYDYCFNITYYTYWDYVLIKLKLIMIYRWIILIDWINQLLLRTYMNNQSSLQLQNIKTVHLYSEHASKLVFQFQIF